MGDIIEGRWDCRHCGEKRILGRHRTCTLCGRPRGKVKFYFGSAAEIAAAPSVTDPEALRQAEAGRDWYCAVCGGGSSALTETCGHCGAPREQTSTAMGPTTVVDKNTYWSVHDFTPRRMRVRNGLVVSGLVVLLYGVMWLTWGFQEHDVLAHVSDAQWTHTTVRDHWTQTVRSDWRMHLTTSEAVMPVDGKGEHGGVQNIRNCRQEIHHYEQYVCGTETVCVDKTRSVSCGTEQSCTVVDNGNGYGERSCTSVTKYCNEYYTECHEETKYCDRPIYETKCDYDTWVWREVESKVASGDGPEVRWEEISPGTLDRIRRLGEYEVELTYRDDGETHQTNHEPTNLDNYLAWASGDRRGVVTVNNFGVVVAVRFADE